MKITNVEYSRVFNLGDFQNEKIGVVVEITDGEDAQTALAEAKNFVDFSSKNFKTELEHARHIVQNPDDYTVRQIKVAEDLVKRFEEKAISSPLLPAKQ